jgi:CheY-like chemotaxis protein
MSSEPTIPFTLQLRVPRFENRRMLLVEDLPPLARRIQEQLRACGMQIEAVPDYHAAVRTLAHGWVPDIALVNLTLPRESGYELCEHIRTLVHLESMPIVVMDERGSPEDLAYAEEVGANAFLKKPFTRDQLIEYVGAMLDGPWVSRPNGVLFLARGLHQ